MAEGGPSESPDPINELVTPCASIFMLIPTLCSYHTTSPVNVPLDGGTSISLHDQISSMIKNNSLGDIKEMFETFQPDQCDRILKTSNTGYTLLFLAIKYERLEIARYLIELSGRQGRHEMCESWKASRHPLSAAILSGNIELVRLVARNLFDINDYVYGPFTPLLLAVCSGYVQYAQLMVRLGARINTPTFCGITPLMLSVFSSNICEFLVTERVDFNLQDREGNTALHLAVLGKNLESVMALVSAGADIRIKNNHGMTPLMLASVQRNLLSVNVLRKRPEYSVVEGIEAFEVISACCVCDRMPILRYWLQALIFRAESCAKRNIAPQQEILDYALEFTRKSELECLYGNPLYLAYQGVLVIERVLGKDNYVYLDCIVKVASIAKDQGKLLKLRQLMEYIKDYSNSKPASFLAACSKSFQDLFTKIADGSVEQFIINGGFYLFKLIAHITMTLWGNYKHLIINNPYFHDTNYSGIVDTFLYMISTIHNMNIPVPYMNEIKDLVILLVNAKPYVVTWQSLLHRVIKLRLTHEWASLALLRVLLQLGADVESKDYFGLTPIKYSLKHTPKEEFSEVVMLLSEYGANVESLDTESALLRTPFPLINAAVINLANQMACTEVMPEVLGDFANLHI